MAGGTLCGDGSVPTLSENSCNCEELMCQSCLKLKAELLEMQTELKSAIAISNILNKEFYTVHDTKGCSRTNQVHGESIQPTSHQLKWIPITAKYQGRKRTSTINQLKTSVENNDRSKELSNLNETLD